jgi:hypothetical protein
MMHLFMAHGVDHLCWRGGQHLAPHGDVCSIFSLETESIRESNTYNRVLTNNQHKNTYIHDEINECYIQHLQNEITKVQHH